MEADRNDNGTSTYRVVDLSLQPPFLPGVLTLAKKSLDLSVSWVCCESRFVGLLGLTSGPDWGGKDFLGQLQAHWQFTVVVDVSG